jgi:hypothetical protein
MNRDLAIIVAALFTLILGLLILQATTSLRFQLPEVEKEPEACIGQPLFVEYTYEGGYIDDHACAVQCQDQIQRYIVYTNNVATQCEKLPGCNDVGEDRGETCEPPMASTL